MHERNLEHGQQCQHRTALGTLMVRTSESTHRQISDVGDEEKRGGGEASVPGPVGTPGDATPQASGDQRDAHEQHADFGRRSGDAVPRERTGSRPQVGRRRHGGDDEGQIRKPRPRHVRVHDAHRLALVHVGRRHEQPEDHQQHDARDGHHTETPREGRAGDVAFGGGRHRLSSRLSWSSSVVEQ